jgi:hypothetical protein
MSSALPPTTTTSGEELPPTEAEALQATLLQEAALLREADALQREEGELDGLAEVLHTARGRQRALVGDFLALCANEVLFPRRPSGGSRGCGTVAPPP